MSKVFEKDKDQEEAIAKFVATTTGAAINGSGTGVGKAQPVDSLVLTPQGFKRMGDISVGDTVVNPDGGESRVSGVYPQGSRPTYRVTLVDGRRIYADEAHLWVVNSAKTRHSGKPDSIMSTREIVESSARNSSRKSMWSIPIINAPDLGDWGSSIDPWVLGFLLGDGSMSQGSVGFSTADQEVIGRIAATLPEGISIQHRGQYDYGITGGMRGGMANPVTVELRRLGLQGKLSIHKSIPPKLFLSSALDRLKLLQGILDADGHVTGRGRSVDIVLGSEMLLDDVIHLARSLGGKATRSTRVIDGKTFWRSVVVLPPSLNPVTLERKVAALQSPGKYALRSLAIRSIEFVGYHDSQCIMVDSENHQYITDGFTRTHNTYIGIKSLQGRGGDRFLIVAPPNTFGGWASTLEAVVGARLRFCGNQAVGLRGGSGYVSKDEAQANMNAAQMGDNGWFFVGRETFVKQCKMTRPVMKGRGANKVPAIDPKTGKPKIKTWYQDNWGGSVPFDGLIYDEMQMAASRTSKSQEVLAKVDSKFKLGQSADWWGTDLDNMYDVHEMFWPGKIGMNKAEWIDEYMETKFDPFTWNKKKTVGESWPGFFATTLPCYVAIPSPVEKPKPDLRLISILPAQRKLYDKLATDMAAEIEGDILVTELPAHLNRRLREISLGMFRVVELEPRIDAEGNLVPRQTVAFDPGAPSSTVDEIKRIHKDYPGESMLVLVGDSQKFAEKAAIDLGGLPYTGKQTAAEKAEAERAFKAGEVKILVGTSAICEGLDGLQDVCRLSVIASRCTVPYLNEQFIGRTARRGQKRPVVAYEIAAMDTIQVGIVHESLKTIFRNNQAKALQARA